MGNRKQGPWRGIFDLVQQSPGVSVQALGRVAQDIDGAGEKPFCVSKTLVDGGTVAGLLRFHPKRKDAYKQWELLAVVQHQILHSAPHLRMEGRGGRSWPALVSLRICALDYSVPNSKPVSKVSF